MRERGKEGGRESRGKEEKKGRKGKLAEKPLKVRGSLLKLGRGEFY